MREQELKDKLVEQTNVCPKCQTEFYVGKNLHGKIQRGEKRWCCKGYCLQYKK